MRQWLYFLVDEEGKSYTVQNGVVKKVSQKTPLGSTPSGWQEISIGWERDMQKIGIVKNFSIPLDFIEDGGEILRHVFYTYGVEAKIFLVIAQYETIWTPPTYRHNYKYFYKGELDLSTFKDNYPKVTVRIMEGGLYKLLKANEGTVQEFSTDDPEFILVKFDGIYLYQSINFLIIKDDLHTAKDFLGIVETTREGTAYGLAAFSIYKSNAPSDLTGNTNYFLTTGIDVADINLSGTLYVRNAFDTTIKLIKEDNTVVATLADINGVGSNSAYIPVAVNANFSALANEKFFLVIDSFLGAVQESNLKISYKSRKPTTYVKAIMPTDLNRKFGRAITGNENNVASELLETNRLKVITCGDAIRSISGAKLKIKYTDFFEDNKVRYGAGMGIENKKIVIEPYAHFFKEQNPILSGPAKELSVSPASDLMYNTLKIGYVEKSIDDVNGKFSFANSHIYSSPLTRIVKELSLVSPFIADPYVIELTRINLEGKTTTDNSRDNDVMILDVVENKTEFVVSDFNAIPMSALIPFSDGSLIQIIGHDDQQPKFQPGLRFQIIGAPTNNGVFTVVNVGDVVAGFGFNLGIKEIMTAEEMDGATLSFSTYELNRPVYDSLTGVPDPDTIFNVELSVKRIVEAQRTWLQSIYSEFVGKELVFKTTEKNAELKTFKDGITFEEKANIEIKSAKLFEPKYIEYDTEVPTNTHELLDGDPNIPFSPEWIGVLWIGFLMKAGIAPDTNQDQSYKLLAAPSNDFKILI